MASRMVRRLVLVVLAATLIACDSDSEAGTSTTSPAPSTTEEQATTTSSAPQTGTTAESSATTSRPELRSLGYETVASGMPFPLFVTSRPGSDMSYVVTRDGRVWSLSGGQSQVLDISDRVTTSGQEQGLLGMALHPDDQSRVFLYYTEASSGGGTVVSEFAVAGDGSIDAGTERVLLAQQQPAANHNGGMLQFGPDGYLYIALGDGGGGGDRFGNGQDPSTLLGSILRIDVDSGDPYGIPPDNPFAEGADGAAEVWAYGLRNPWRFWIDQSEETIYIADVGQNAFEEVDVIGLEDANGANFGWPITEGTHCYSQSGCSTEGKILPVIEVQHGDAGTCSITGGVVYRGEAIPELDGRYLYSDYCGGWLRSFRWDGSQVTEATDWTEQVGVPGRVTSFGVDATGEVYVTTADSVLRLVARR